MPRVLLLSKLIAYGADKNLNTLHTFIPFESYTACTYIYIMHKVKMTMLFPVCFEVERLFNNFNYFDRKVNVHTFSK